MADPMAVRGAIMSGLGISRIGRRLGIPRGDLTEEAARLAIADAGLTSADIDGIATIGDTPIAEAATRLGISPSWTGGDMGRYGLLSPVVNAFEAVGTGAARHVLVYRTVNMIGGEASGAGGGDPGPASADRCGTSAGCSPCTRTRRPTGSPCTCAGTCTSTARPRNSSAGSP